MAKMLPDEILREAGRLLASGYPPDALGPIKTWYRIQDASGAFYDHNMYADIGRLRGTLPNPDGGGRFYRKYENEVARSKGQRVVKTIEIVVESKSIEEAVWAVKEADAKKREEAAARRVAKRMAGNE